MPAVYLEARGKKLLFIDLCILFKMHILPLASEYLASGCEVGFMI